MQHCIMKAIGHTAGPVQGKKVKKKCKDSHSSSSSSQINMILGTGWLNIGRRGEKKKKNTIGKNEKHVVFKERKISPQYHLEC